MLPQTKSFYVDGTSDTNMKTCASIVSPLADCVSVLIAVFGEDNE